MSRKLKIKNMKSMSIIGIVWFTLSLLCIIGFYESDLEASAGWGMLGMLYAIPLSIVSLVNSKKAKNNNPYNELIKLSDLKEKGIISDEEFNAKKMDILKT
jgi:hypothetical protein